MSTTSKIEINVDLDEKRIPKDIKWMATDSPQEEPQDSSAFFLSFWDPAKKEDKTIHLWTKELTVEEMNHFFVRTLMLMSDTLEKATGNSEEAAKLREFTYGFGDRTQVLKKT